MPTTPSRYALQVTADSATLWELIRLALAKFFPRWMGDEGEGLQSHFICNYLEAPRGLYSLQIQSSQCLLGTTTTGCLG